MRRVDFFDAHGTNVMMPMVGGYAVMRASGMCTGNENVDLVHEDKKTIGGNGTCVHVSGKTPSADIRFDIKHESKFGKYEAQGVVWHYHYRLCKYRFYLARVRLGMTPLVTRLTR
jgi:hypothetical protein